MLVELSNAERAERIRQLIEHLPGQKAQLAERFKISAQAITGWEKTGRIARANMARLAAEAGKPAAYLIYRNWEEASATTATPDDEDWPDVLAYKQAASLGDGAVPDEYAETHKLKFRADSLRRKRLDPERLGVVYGRGDSMLPRIRSGDAIMFDMRRTDPVDGALFVVSYDGGLMAKQLVQLGGRWFIESLNKDDPKWRKPQPIDEHRGFAIHGRVVWIGSWED